MWQCKKCKSSNEDQFELCWKCGFDKSGNPSDHIEEFENRKKEVISKNIREKTNLITKLGVIVALLFFIATIYFIADFNRDNQSLSIILIISSFSNSVLFLLLSEMLETLISIKNRK